MSAMTTMVDKRITLCYFLHKVDPEGSYALSRPGTAH